MKEFKDHTFVVCAYQESEYLEEVVKSLECQTVKSHIIMATSTPNDWIREIAQKHQIKLFVNDTGKTGIGPDWNFAVSCVKTKFVTLAHQDDIYDSHYTEEIDAKVQKYQDAIMLFTNYKEIRNREIVKKNINLKIKSFMIFPVRLMPYWSWCKKLILRFGNPICCPSVCLNIEKTGENPFREDMKSNIDWGTWYDFATKKGAFLYIKNILTYHRVHENSETSRCLNNSQRFQEDYEMFCRIWPKWFAKFIMIFYKWAGRSNKVDYGRN